MRQREQALVLMDKARQDEGLVREVLHAEHIADELIGFHCQQAIEKLLKAALTAWGVRYRRTHDLRELMDVLTDTGHPLPDSLESADAFTPYAIVHRYEAIAPPVTLDRAGALDMVRRVREWAETQVHGQDTGQGAPAQSP